MKTNYALVTGMLLATSLMAQTNSSAPEVAAAPAATAESAAAVTTNKPVAKKPAPKRRKVIEKLVSLQPGPAVVDAYHVNVRGRSTILSEVLTQLNKGDKVTVLEQVENKWAKGDDMRQWARIAYPSNAPCWVFATYIDTNKTVTASRLNLRGGPGENYSVVGRVPKGAAVTEIETKGEWMRIVPPEAATAYMAAMYLKQDAQMLAAAPPVEHPPIEPASTNVITDLQPVADTVDIGSMTMEGTNAPVIMNEVADEANAPEEPPAPRIVMREGIVRNATSIQAPSYYSLTGLDTGRTINYLYTTSTNVNLNRYANLHVIVTGEESLDERWPNTPVLTLQRIQVVDE